MPAAISLETAAKLKYSIVPCEITRTIHNQNHLQGANLIIVYLGFSYQFSIDGLILVLAIRVFEVLVSCELNCAVGHSEHPWHETLKQNKC